MKKIESGQSPEMESKQVVDQVYGKSKNKSYRPDVCDWEKAFAEIIKDRNKAQDRAIELKEENISLREDVRRLEKELKSK